MQSPIVTVLSLLTLFSHILVIPLIMLHFPRFKHIGNKVKKYLLHFSLLVCLTATFGSLYFSEILHFTPCKLCWYQRIFMYPQVFIVLLALLKKDIHIRLYLVVLNGIGLAIAVYHYLLQRLPTNTIGICSVGGEVSCSKNFILLLGYITIPLMSASAFLLNILFLSLMNSIKKHGSA